MIPSVFPIVGVKYNDMPECQLPNGLFTKFYVSDTIGDKELDPI